MDTHHTRLFEYDDNDQLLEIVHYFLTFRVQFFGITTTLSSWKNICVVHGLRIGTQDTGYTWSIIQWQ